MKEILGDIERWRRGGERFALATVVATRRSAPRPAGAKLGVSSGGELAGSVSGGCVENEVYGVAQEVLEGARPCLLTYGISDDLAFEVGLPCGGEIDVFVEEADQELVDRVRHVVESERRAVLFTVVEGEGVGKRWLAVEGEPTDAPAELEAEVGALLRSGRSTVLEHEGRRVFADVYEPPPRLVVIGAVDTAEALCAAAKQLGWRTIVADARAKFATRERIPSADELVVGWPDEVFARVGLDYATAVVVLTHDDRFDIPALRAALQTEAFYIGALGSRRNQERRREKLLEAGVEEGELERISGPSGLDIGAVSPAETALSILAEILARPRPLPPPRRGRRPRLLRPRAEPRGRAAAPRLRRALPARRRRADRGAQDLPVRKQPRRALSPRPPPQLPAGGGRGRLLRARVQVLLGGR